MEAKGEADRFIPYTEAVHYQHHNFKEIDRITVIFGPAGSREVLADQWTVQRTWQRPGPWRGYTLLRVSGDASATSAAEVTAASEASDGSFECVTEP